MKDMKCYQCVLKHIATAISYGKEIMINHGAGADLDHRPDYLGELVNAGHHLKLLDNNLFNLLEKFRQKAQDENLIVRFSDLQYLRKLWHLIENKVDEDMTLDIDIENNNKTGCKTCGGKSKRKRLSVDVVIPVADKGSHEDNIELKYCLRAIEKNLKFYDRIILVGDNIPDWVTNVKKVSEPDTNRKNITLFNKRLKAANASTAHFNLYMCDDYIINQPINALSVPCLTNGSSMFDYTGDRVWHKCLRATGEALKAHGRKTVNCESHTPSLCNRQKFIELANIFDTERNTEPGVVVCGLYHNYYQTRMLPMDKYKATFESNITLDEVTNKSANMMFIGYDDKAYKTVIEYLQKEYPGKSKFEI